MSRVIKKIIKRLIPKIKKLLSLFLSENQITMIKKKILGRTKQHRHKQKIIKYKKHLYEYGFYDRALQDLHDYYNSLKIGKYKIDVAWELALWYSSQYNENDAQKALDYLYEILEQNKGMLKQASIIASECLQLLKREDEAKEIIKHALEKETHPDLFLAMANLEMDNNSRLKWINKAYSYYNLDQISFKNSSEPSYNDLKMKNDSKVNNTDILVSIIIPAYNAEDEIAIAINSLLKQTWKNIEIIVVDDCSTDRTRESVKRFMEVDSRIKLLSTPINSGPYVARNIGLKASKGEFITINDADDWSHSQKIEIQANHLIKNKKVVANTSEHARLTNELNFYRRGTPGRYIFSNMSSLMFRRNEVLKRIGYWDSVRFAGDGEFKRRLIRVFGSGKVVDLQTGPLSLPKQSVSSLTGSSAYGYHGYFKGVRKEYVESLENYHQSGKSLYFNYPMDERPFPIPGPMRPQRKIDKTGFRNFHSVIIHDFRFMSEDVINKMEKIINNNKKLGIVQLYSYGLESDMIDIKFRSFMNENDVELIVYGEKIRTNEIYIFTFNVFEEYQAYVPQIITENITILDKHITLNNNESKHIENITKHFNEAVKWNTNNTSVRNMLQQMDIKVNFLE